MLLHKMATSGAKVEHEESVEPCAPALGQGRIKKPHNGAHFEPLCCLKHKDKHHRGCDATHVCVPESSRTKNHAIGVSFGKPCNVYIESFETRVLSSVVCLNIPASTQEARIVRTLGQFGSRRGFPRSTETWCTLHGHLIRPTTTLVREHSVQIY